MHVSLSLEPTKATALDARAGETGTEDIATSWMDTVIAGRSYFSWMADLFAVIVLCVLTGVSLAFAVHDERHDTRTYAMRPRSFIWFSILLGPSGCLLRWKLGLLNGKVRAWQPVILPSACMTWVTRNARPA